MKLVLSHLLNNLCTFKKSFLLFIGGEGPSESLESVFIFKSFFLKLSSSIVRYGAPLSVFADAAILMGPVGLCYLDSVNPRYQSPVFNIYLRNLYTHSEPVFLVSGTLPFCNYSYQHISNVPVYRASALRGKLWVASLFQSVEYPLAIVSDQSYQNVFLLQYTNLLQPSFWLGFYVLSPRSTYYSKHYVHGPHVRRGKASPFSFSYDINCSSYTHPRIVDRCSVSIFQGHHGESLVPSLYDFVFPTKTFVEANSLFINMFGSFSKTNKAFNLSSFYDSRMGWKVIVMVARIFGVFLPSASIQGLLQAFPVQERCSWMFNGNFSSNSRIMS